MPDSVEQVKASEVREGDTIWSVELNDGEQGRFRKVLAIDSVEGGSGRFHYDNDEYEPFGSEENVLRLVSPTQEVSPQPVSDDEARALAEGAARLHRPPPAPPTQRQVVDERETRGRVRRRRFSTGQITYPTPPTEAFPAPRESDCDYGCCKAGDEGVASEAPTERERPETWMVDYEHGEGEPQHAVLSWLDDEAKVLPEVGTQLVRKSDYDGLAWDKRQEAMHHEGVLRIKREIQEERDRLHARALKAEAALALHTKQGGEVERYDVDTPLDPSKPQPVIPSSDSHEDKDMPSPYESVRSPSPIGKRSKEASCDDHGDDVQAAGASAIGTTRRGSATNAVTSGTPTTIPADLRPLATTLARVADQLPVGALRDEVTTALRGLLSWPGKPGEHRWIACGLDAYHAINLQEALKVVPDTGDWHGSLRAACHIALSRHEAEGYRPNQTAEQMRDRLASEVQPRGDGDTNTDWWTE